MDNIWRGVRRCEGGERGRVPRGEEDEAKVQGKGQYAEREEGAEEGRGRGGRGGQIWRRRSKMGREEKKKELEEMEGLSAEKEEMPASTNVDNLIEISLK